MKVNKTILWGLILILFSCVIFSTNFLNPIIRPVTHLFLMGSSKGKDIIFFALLGILLILSQLNIKKINQRKYLKISIIIGSVLLISGIILEIIFRVNLGIGFNNTFCAMSNTTSSTSILHSHLLKSILGEGITQIMGPFVESNINTGVGLYGYVPKFGFLIILLIPLLFFTSILSLQNRLYPTIAFLSFFTSCLIIGSFDGCLFSTPAMTGICGFYVVYRNEFYINRFFGKIFKDEKLLKENEQVSLPYPRYGTSQRKYLINRLLPYIVIILIICLRFTVAFAGAETDYYTVEIEDIDDNVDFGKIPITHIDNNIYHVSSNYTEKDLINDLKIPLNNSCEYYTVSWNIYTYFSSDYVKETIFDFTPFLD